MASTTLSHEPLQSVLAACASLARTFESVALTADARRAFDALGRSLGPHWDVHSVNAARNLGAELDDESGYLRRGDVRVPFYLYANLPNPETLDQIVEVGESLRVSDKSAICLAGSATMLKALGHIGDLDYCEYVPYRDADTAAVVAAVTRHAMRGSAPLCFVVKRFPFEDWFRRCPSGWTADAQNEFRRMLVLGGRKYKLDFVAKAGEPVGVVEATNVVLLYESRDDESLRAGFAAQEVVTHDADLPHRLDDAYQLGRYINFLLDTIRKVHAAKPAKALKRALSLTRILGLVEREDAILALLREDHGGLAAALEAREKVLQALREDVAEHGRSARGTEARSLSDQLEPRLVSTRKRFTGKAAVGKQRDWNARASAEATATSDDVAALIAAL